MRANVTQIWTAGGRCPDPQPSGMADWLRVIAVLPDGALATIEMTEGRHVTVAAETVRSRGYARAGAPCADCEGWVYYPYLSNHKGYPVDVDRRCLRCARTGIEPGTETCCSCDGHNGGWAGADYLDAEFWWDPDCVVHTTDPNDD